MDVTTASPAAHTVRLVDLLAELEAADATDSAYEEVVLDGQLFREIVSTLRLVACSGDPGTTVAPRRTPSHRTSGP